jgi:hypothetical protein
MKDRLIEIVNPQPEIRRNAETADWEFKDEASYLYNKAIALRERLIDPIARIDRKQLPDPVIGFENLRNYKVLAEYLLFRDAVGLNCRINFNIEHYEEKDGKKVWKWGRWAQLETLTHEYVHLFQQQVGSGKPNHGREFIDKCESLGLHPLPGVGCHIAVATEPFSILMKEWGIEQPDNVPSVPPEFKIDWFKLGKESKGRSSLSRWTCGCQNARIGAKEFHAKCTKCGNEFVKMDGNVHYIYKFTK